MPYKFEIDKTRLNREDDRRVKLSERERAEIVRRHSEKEPIRSISRAFPHVSRRTVQYVIFPERAAKVAEQYKARGQSKKSYERVKGENWNNTMREHRRYKSQALKRRSSVVPK